MDIKNNLREMKNVFGDFISGLEMAVDRISALEDVSIQTAQIEKQREKTLKKKIEQHIKGLWDNYKKCNMCKMWILEGKEKWTEEIFKTMIENLPKLMSHTKSHIQEAQNTMWD